MESILTSIKKLLGIGEEHSSFDTDIVMYINAAFSVLTQIGVGPASGFAIKDANAKWSDYLNGDARLEMVKTYVYLKVRLMFDPPLNSSVTEVIKSQIAELEWRINVQVDPGEVINP